MPRSESLLWLQLLGLGVMPLEALLLLLLLAGSDPGPWPGLERLLCWAIGSLVPAYLLWRRPADPFSLLLLQVPQRGRSRLQLQLSALQATPLLQVGLVLGCLSSLALLWWVDAHAAVATALSPLGGSSRLLALLLAAAILALLLWQWQQVLQSLWLLRCPPSRLAATSPMGLDSLNNQRLLLGIPLLLPVPLQMASPRSRPSTGAQPTTQAASPVRAEVQPESNAEPKPRYQDPLPAHPAEAGLLPQDPHQQVQASQALQPEVVSPRPEDPTPSAGLPSGGGTTVAVEPEQAAADEESGGLDQQIG
jgi:hypothetical protein